MSKEIVRAPSPFGLADARLNEAVPVGSRLYLDYVLPDDSHGGISREVWAGTPWIATIWTDSCSTAEGIIRHSGMMKWLRERYGEPARPFADPPQPGRWREGNATVCGWTWFGFDTEERMQEFIAAWPAPGSDEPLKAAHGTAREPNTLGDA